MIFEVTRNYTIIVPLMVSNLTAFYISQKLQPEPIYEALARQDGLHLPTGGARDQVPQFRVVTAVRESPPPLDPALSLGEARHIVEGSSLGSWPVADEDGLLGMVRVADLLAAPAGDGVQVRDLLDPETSEPHAEHGGDAVAHVHTDHSLGQALARMGATRHTVLPVVSRANARILLGVVTLPDVLTAYGVAQSAESGAPVDRVGGLDG
jgi:CIC family chloride channel protein